MVVSCPRCGAVQQIETESGLARFTCIVCHEAVSASVRSQAAEAVPPATGRLRGVEEGKSTSASFAYDAPSGLEPEAMIGQVVNGFRFLEFLGEGPWALVYRGEQVALRRILALRVLKREFVADSERIASFLEAARDAASLLHPHILKIVDVVSAGDVHFVAQELARGTPALKSIQPGKALSPEEVVQLGITLADALEVSHRQGRVHGNLHPGNLFLGTGGAVQVTGFYERAVLGAGLPVGVPAQKRLVFLPPEILRGSSDPSGVGPDTDVYLLGGILYFCLTGRPPYRLGDLEAIAGGAEGYPGAPMADQENPVVPKGLALILRSMLQPDRRGRIESVEAVALRLGEFLDAFRQYAQLLPPETVQARTRELGPALERRYKRLRSDMDVEVTPRETDEHKAIRLISGLENVSENGAFVTTPSPLPVGSLVTLEFNLAEKATRVRVLGLVRWIRESLDETGMGVQFIEISTTDQRALREFVDERLAAEAGRMLTRTPLHRAVLNLVAEGFGKVLPLPPLVARSGVSERMLGEILGEFERFGLVRRLHGGVRSVRPVSPRLAAVVRTLLASGDST